MRFARLPALVQALQRCTSRACGGRSLQYSELASCKALGRKPLDKAAAGTP
jgi:hypothetical protein